MNLAIIIPARNEAGCLAAVLDRIPAGLARQVIVVDNGSTDATPAIALRHGAEVVAEPRRGYGQACLTGLARLRDEIEVVGFLDADGSDDPHNLVTLLGPIRENAAEFVVSARRLGLARANLSPQQKFGNALACLLMRLIWGYRYTDLGPLRVIRRDALERLQMRDRTWGWTVEMQIRAVQAGLRIRQIDVAYGHRIAGEIKNLGFGGRDDPSRCEDSGDDWPARASQAAAHASRATRVAGDPRVKTELLVIMARYPTYGKVKTRLATEIGKRQALAVYRALLAHHVREFSRATGDVEWRYTPARSPFRGLVERASRPFTPGANGRDARSTITARPQPAGDLGERMERIFADAFARGYRRVVMIGTDAPEMNSGTVRRAWRLLRAHDVVLQPAEDGGYALLGLRRLVPVFAGIPWSTARVLSRTRARLRRLGVGHAELAMTYDIDTATDLRRWAGCPVRRVPG